MKVKIIRDLTTERNKEQEDSFANTMNLALYFDTNKSIDKFDGWSFSNAKKLTNYISEETIINIYYSKWNQNIEYLYKELKPTSELMIEDLCEEINNAFRNKDIEKIHEIIKESDDNLNIKLSLLILIAEVTNSEKVINIINKVINNGVLTPQSALDMVLPILLIGGENE